VSVADEVGALRAAAGLSRAEHVAVVHVEGPDAFDLLQHASTQAPYPREGRVRHTLLLREDAGIFADAYIVAVDDGYLVLAEGPGEAELASWLETLRDGKSPARRVSIRAGSGETVVLGVDGPYAWEVTAALLGPVVLGMPYLSLLRRDDLLCVRAGKTGEYGYLLLAPRGAAGDLERKLVEVGRPLDLAAVGRAALDVCALENGHFSMRNVRDVPTVSPLTPIELQLQWRVVYERDCVGAAALKARRAEGVRVRATCFTAEGPVAAGDRALLADHDAGEILAACFSPTLGSWIGSALLDIRVAHPHLTLTATTASGPVNLRTRTAPLLDNRSLHIDPHKHSYATRDAVALAVGAAR
jgi:glycine cleavage system aminomethyltransferase T